MWTAHLLADAGDHLGDVDGGALGAALAHDERRVVAGQAGHALVARRRADARQQALRNNRVDKANQLDAEVLSFAAVGSIHQQSRIGM